MEGIRDNFTKGIAPASTILDDEEDFQAEFPVIVAEGERRMQVRAYCHWSTLLGGHTLPLIADLRLDQLDDLAPNSVLLDVRDSAADPRIAYLGASLARECDVAQTVRHLDQVPDNTLLSRMAGQFDEIFVSQAPIGFEAEFANQRGATILYRAMLMPFADVEGGPVAFLLCAFSWKERADDALSDEIAAQIAMAFPGATLPTISDEEEADTAPTSRQTAVAMLAALELNAVPDDVAQHMTLEDWLASARELAQTARLTTERSRQALYAAIGRTHDLALVASEQPDALRALLQGADLAPQPRAPLLPLVKLVFGADYDKTRLTEYAAVLTHALRLGLGRGQLAEHLARAAGGLKGIVAEERRLRQTERRRRPRERSLARLLSVLAPRPLESLSPRGAEYTLLLAHRLADGTIALLGEVDDPALLAGAAQRLAG